MDSVLTLKRKWFTDESTVGELYLDGDYLCFTLEDTVREEKIPGETAIPEGRYEVILSFSARFKAYLPLLINVPNFEGVRIHPGNKAEDTEGCILVGDTRGENFVGNSRTTFSFLLAKLESAVRHGKVWIDIRNTRDESTVA